MLCLVLARRDSAGAPPVQSPASPLSSPAPRPPPTTRSAALSARPPPANPSSSLRLPLAVAAASQSPITVARSLIAPAIGSLRNHLIESACGKDPAPRLGLRSVGTGAHWYVVVLPSVPVSPQPARRTYRQSSRRSTGCARRCLRPGRRRRRRIARPFRSPSALLRRSVLTSGLRSRSRHSSNQRGFRE